MCLQTIRHCKPRNVNEALLYARQYLERLGYKDNHELWNNVKEMLEEKKNDFKPNSKKGSGPENPTLEHINEYLPVSFCPVCLLFMCPKHLSASIDSNPWTFTRIR